MLTSRLDAYISKYSDFCAHDDNDNNDDNDTTDYFTPCACARGNYLLAAIHCWIIIKLIVKLNAYKNNKIQKIIMLRFEAHNYGIMRCLIN